jgi:hypothetical protein
MFILISVSMHKQTMMYYKVREITKYVIMSLTLVIQFYILIFNVYYDFIFLMYSLLDCL